MTFWFVLFLRVNYGIVAFIVPALGRLGLENGECKVSLGYIPRFSFKVKK